ncbi:Hypothetical protein SMAX5B_002000 [Scophthalmus maximus]|uniref:Uncharacterized protein n=1 Tax=Scophthalmus maximus TaxID=52904 RepID=A0A2U9CW96_SCOMX|nr:Hypothetical protein SMAX5B_002000 [Scophthalmus maximus]
MESTTFLRYDSASDLCPPGRPTGNGSPILATDKTREAGPLCESRKKGAGGSSCIIGPACEVVFLASGVIRGDGEDGLRPREPIYLRCRSTDGRLSAAHARAQGLPCRPCRQRGARQQSRAIFTLLAPWTRTSPGLTFELPQQRSRAVECVFRCARHTVMAGGSRGQLG